MNQWQTKIDNLMWAGEHQEAFDLLKSYLTNAPVLGYPDSVVLLNWRLTHHYKVWVLYFPQGMKNGTSHVIAYASRSLLPSKQSMQNFSSVKLELLALKWVMREKLKDYFLRSKFTIYTDNYPLAYIKESKLGAAQIQWFCELALFNFNIKYRSGKLNQAADALSHHPKSDNENFSDSESDGYETISYTVVCDDLCDVIKGENYP